VRTFIYVLLLESFCFLIHVSNWGRVEGKRRKEKNERRGEILEEGRRTERRLII